MIPRLAGWPHSCETHCTHMYILHKWVYRYIFHLYDRPQWHTFAPRQGAITKLFIIMHRQKNTKSVVRIAFLHLAAVQIFRLTRLSLKSFVFVGPSPSVSCAAACGDACGGTYLFVILLVLIIEIRLERQLCAAVYAFEATGMEECEIL